MLLQSGLAPATNIVSRLKSCVLGFVSNTSSRVVKFPYHKKIVSQKIVPIEDVIDNYSAAEDFLLVFRNGHTDLFFDSRFFNWDGNKYVSKSDRTGVPGHSLVIRVRAGVERIKKMHQLLDNEVYQNWRGLNCNHTSLLFLEYADVQLHGAFPIAASTMLELVIESGFRSGKGKIFDTEVYSLGSNAESDLLAETRLFLYQDEIEKFEERIKAMNIGQREFKRISISLLSSDPELKAIGDVIYNPVLKPNLTPRQKLFLSALFRRLERRLASRIKSKFKSSFEARVWMATAPSQSRRDFIQTHAMDSFQKAITDLLPFRGDQMTFSFYNLFGFGRRWLNRFWNGIP